MAGPKDTVSKVPEKRVLPVHPFETGPVVTGLMTKITDVIKGAVEEIRTERGHGTAFLWDTDHQTYSCGE